MVSLSVTSSRDEKIEHKTQQAFEKFGMRGSVEFAQVEPGELVHHAIIRTLMSKEAPEEYIDFVVVANHGANMSSHTDKKYLGSVANGIIRNSKINVVFVPV